MAKIKEVESVDGTEQPVIVVLDDGTEVNLSELDGGFMRQKDYTQKTQALAVEKQALETADANHQVNTSLNSQPDVNKSNVEIEKMYLDMKMEKLKDLHGDSFDEVAVLKKAASMLKSGVKPTDIDFDFIARGLQTNNADETKEAMRKEIIAEMVKSGVDTSSIISSGDNGGAIDDGTFGLTPDELKYCAKTDEDPKTYAKWKNRKK